MACRYTLKDAERWAEFSGDYNPIHFDPARARLLGSEHLLVHGMRAMLDMKRALSLRFLDCNTSPPWLKFTARLRRPLLCGKLYNLNVMQSGERFNAILSNSEDRSEHYTARLAPVSPQARLFEPPGELRTQAITSALKSCFPGRADDPAERWVFLDAMLFQAFFSSTELLSSLRQAGPSCAASSLLEYFALTQVVQTHHEVQFSAELFDLVLGPSLLIDIPMPQVVGSPKEGFVMRIDIRGWSGSRPQIFTSATFRILPQSPTHQ